MSVSENYQKIKHSIPGGKVTLVAVTKTQPVQKIQELYQAGQRDFGENKVQELMTKTEFLPTDARWHLIGHLQSNKVKYIAGFIHLIHSVDSMSLLKEINKQAQKENRVIDCLLQIYIAKEETKFGLSEEEAEDIISHLNDLRHVRICGLMGMATNTENEAQVRSEFRHLKSYFDQVKQRYFADKPGFDTLSMGMSGDYLDAIEEGSTMVRVGSAIFGERPVQEPQK